jgi:hypothetical protein
MAEPGGAFSAYSAMTDKGNVDRGLRIVEFGAALAEPVAATVLLPLRFRIGRRTLMELLVPTRPQAAVAISSQYLKRESQGFVPGSRTCPTKPAFGRKPSRTGWRSRQQLRSDALDCPIPWEAKPIANNNQPNP